MRQGKSDDTCSRETRIAVVGVGGVGGYVAGMLAAAYPHVTLVARGTRGDAIRQNGMVLHSDYQGEIVARPERVVESSSLMGPQDVVFLCVKNNSLEQACAELKESMTPKTVVVPVMNGADPGDRTRELLGIGTVVDALIYIVAFANDDYSVTQCGKYANLKIGVKGSDAAGHGAVAEVAEVAAVLFGAHIDVDVSDDIERDIWRKYLLNCALNVLTAAYDATVGELRADPDKMQEFSDLVNEAYGVARCKGVHVGEDDVAGIIERFRTELPSGSTSSLQRDVHEGRRGELDTFCGYIVKEAARLGVSVPVTERLYAALSKRFE